MLLHKFARAYGWSLSDLEQLTLKEVEYMSSILIQEELKESYRRG